jgi:hypothetical protein
MPNLERRKRMHMHRRIDALDGTQDLEVGAAGEVWMNAALQAYLRGAALTRLAHSIGQHLQVQQVGLLGAFVFTGSFGEGAKRTSVAADIGVIDVAIYDVSQIVAVCGGTQIVGGGAQILEISAARFEQTGPRRNIQLLGTVIYAKCLGRRRAR